MRQCWMVLVLGFVAFTSVGCATMGNFDEKGYAHPRYGYTVDYTDPRSKSFISADWRLDNYFMRQDTLEMKTGDNYQHDIKLDQDGNGEYETTEKTFIYDLALEHTRFEQEIWVRTPPISKTNRNKDLDVLMRQYIESVSGAGYEAVSLTQDRTVIVQSRRFATVLVAKSRLNLGGHEALAVVFDVANVDQVTVTPTDRIKRVAMIFVKTPFGFSATQYGDGYSGDTVDSAFPVLMVLAYASHPDDFASGLADFERLVCQVVIRSVASRSSFDKSFTPLEARSNPGAPLTLPPNFFESLLAQATPVAPVALPMQPPPPLASPADDSSAVPTSAVERVVIPDATTASPAPLAQ
jgi:hypothetical protein